MEDLTNYKLGSKGLRYSLFIAGLFWHRDEKTLTSVLRGCYEAFVIVVLLVSLGRCLGSFSQTTSGSGAIFMNVTLTLWTLQVLLDTLIMLKMSWPRGGSYHKLIAFWDEEIAPFLNRTQSYSRFRRLKIFLKIALLITWLQNMINIAFSAFIVMAPSHVIDEYITSALTSPLVKNMATEICVAIWMTVASGGWLLSVMYAIHVTSFLSLGFKTCNEYFKQNLETEPVAKPGSKFNDFKNTYTKFLQCVDIVGCDMSLMFGNWFATNIPLACFLMYNIIHAELAPLHVLMNVFWCSASVGHVVLSSSFACWLHEMAHSPLTFIYDVSLEGATVEQYGTVQLFISKLAGKSTGFTVLNFIVITKELMLTLGGLYLTYFFLMLQF